MNPFSEDHSDSERQPGDSPASDESRLQPTEQQAALTSADSPETLSAGDPFPITAVSAPPPPSPLAFLPEDLRVSWSWLHLLFFVLFSFGSIIIIDIFLAIYLSAGQRVPTKDLEQLLQSKPELAVAFNVVWFFLILLFLYVTLAAVRGRPFWPTLGWKRLGAKPSAPTNPWVYFAGGIALAILVAVISTRIKTPDHIPIQDLFKNRTSAILLMGMAVLVAPLVEETVFRGYLYPLFASTTSRIAKGFGADPDRAVRTGTATAIVVTGILFGMLHGAQLGWTRALVLMLSVVGIIFTFARARAGTVLASFLLHLGYNSMIAFSAMVTTKGFTQLPPPHP